ncbi:hypothetical protein [Agathobacter ruminis]|uniref:hypothetical protein n=1 Tax=Agathobacter ruminis TaxID=1712665 RepID=UPI001670827B|nr:hypothetical protein [Agathobacter ruminis]
MGCIGSAIIAYAYGYRTVENVNYFNGETTTRLVRDSALTAGIFGGAISVVIIVTILLYVFGDIHEKIRFMASQSHNITTLLKDLKENAGNMPTDNEHNQVAPMTNNLPPQ